MTQPTATATHHERIDLDAIAIGAGRHPAITTAVAICGGMVAMGLVGIIVVGRDMAPVLPFMTGLAALSTGIVCSAVSRGRGLDTGVAFTEYGTVAIAGHELALADVDRFSIGPAQPGRVGSSHARLHPTSFVLSVVARDGSLHPGAVSHTGDISWPGNARKGAEVELRGNEELARRTGRPVPPPSPLAQVVLDRTEAHQSGEQPWTIRWGRLAVAGGVGVVFAGVVWLLSGGSTLPIVVALALPPVVATPVLRTIGTADEQLQLSLDGLDHPWRLTETLPEEPPVVAAERQGPRIPYWVRGVAVAYWLAVATALVIGLV